MTTYPHFRAILLAGDVGHQLAPLPCEACCKPLLPVCGIPMLHHAFRAVQRAGAQHIAVVAPPGCAKEIELSLSEIADNPDYFHVFSSAQPQDSADAIRSTLSWQNETRPSSSYGPNQTSAHAESLSLIASEKSMDDNMSVLVVPGDLVTDIDLKKVVEEHMDTYASCTVALAQASFSKSSDFAPSTYTLVDPSGSRIIGIVDHEDLNGDMLSVRMPLLRRYPSVRVLANMIDSQIYVFAPWVLQRLLLETSNISSVHLDLVPYLAKRQFTIARNAQADGWSRELPVGGCDSVRVSSFVVPCNYFIRRVNTIADYLSVNIEAPQSINLSSNIDEASLESTSVSTAAKEGKEGKDKKKSKPVKPAVSPFAKVGERVNVSADSRVGRDCSAGDRTSVKKSCVGNRVELGISVKVNGTVILDDVVVHDNVNLNGCVIGAGAVVGRGCVLKNCRVAFGVNVADGMECCDKDLTGADSGMLDEIEFAD